MKWILLLSSLLVFAITAHADEYDDCILKGMKGVSSDVGARLVAEACRNKVDEPKRAKQRAKRERFGSKLNESEYKIGNSYMSSGGGYISLTLQNTSSSKTLTYVELTVKDGDYYDYKGPKNPPPNDRMPWEVIEEDDWSKWTRERTHTYYFKLTLKPGKEIRLMFPDTRTKSFYSEITTALGREAKWTDAASTISFSDRIKPELQDPLQ